MTGNLTHIAIIPDGTRRWARKRGLPEMEGAKAGAENMHRILAYLLDAGLRYLTVWGFSTDNWKRSEDQIRFLFEQAEVWIRRDAPLLAEKNVKLRVIGHFAELPPGLREAIKRALAITRYKYGMTLILAFNYSGRAELVYAVRSMIGDSVPADKVDEILISQYLYTRGIPDVDLVIRTGGELRLSNFMIWQAAYSELYFTDVLWPDFDEKELEKALEVYSERQRRFGGD